MSSGHLVGYVGGLAVALGIGTALWLDTPTAAADTGSTVTHSASSPGTAKSARAAGKATTGPRRPTAAATIPIAGDRELTTTEVYAGTGYTTDVAVVDAATGTQIGDPVTLDGRVARSPLVTVDGKQVLIAASDDFAYPHYTSHVAVLDIATGAQLGSTVGLSGNLGDLQLVGTKGRAVITTYVHNPVTNTGTTQFTVIDATTGATVGGPLTLDGNPWSTSLMSLDRTHALVTTTVLDGGNTPIATNLAVLDTTDGTQSGATHRLDGGLVGDPLVSKDGKHVLISTNDDPWNIRSDSHTQIMVVDTTNGEQAGSTLTLDGHAALGPVVNADGIHALFVVGESASTRIVVVDTATGKQTGSVTLGGTANYTHTDTDRAHVLVTTTDGAFLRTTVVDTETGTQISGATVALAGPIGYTVADAEGAHVLFTTTDGAATHVAVIDGHSGEQNGTTVTVMGELFSWEQPLISANGTRVLLTVHEPVDNVDNWTHLVTIDTVAGAQAGATVTLPGWKTATLSTADGDRATIVTSVPASAKHGSSSHIAVIDTTTGKQVGDTVRLTGRQSGAPTLSADGQHLVVTTAAGVRANLDITTGTAAVTIARAPWGVDLDAFALTPLGRVVTAIQVAVLNAGAGLFAFVFFGYLWLAGFIAHLPAHQAATVSTALTP